MKCRHVCFVIAINVPGASRDRGEAHVIIVGSNYGQGSSRENAAAAPRYLGLQVVIAKSFARIQWQNLINFGVLPLSFAHPSNYDGIADGAVLRPTGVIQSLKSGQDIHVQFDGADASIMLRHSLSPYQIDMLTVGGAINWRRNKANPAKEQSK